MLSTSKGLLKNYNFRITLMYLGLFLLSSLILFAFIFVSSTRNVTKQLDETLQTEKTAFTERYVQSGLNGLIRLVNTRVQIESPQAAFSLINENKEIIAGNLAHWPNVLNQAGLVEFQHDYRGGAAPVSYRGEVIALPDKQTLLIARSRQYIVDSQNQLIRMFLSAAAITLLLGLIGGIFLSKHAVRRIAKINRLCRSIIEGDISQRLNINQAHDDLDDLSLNINSMLNKIEELMLEIVQVSDNIAHDMRTPLSHLRLKLEALQAQIDEEPRDKNKQSTALKQIKTGLSEAVNDSDEIIETFNALMRISKIGSKFRKEQFNKLDISPLIHDVIALYQPIAEEKSQTMLADINQTLWVQGNKNLLFQALVNIVDNAIKYSPEKSIITLSGKQLDDQIILQICDKGMGVDDEAIKHLSKRFYRADASRSLPGNGLGLSLVDAIAKAHQASLTYAHNTPRGLCVALTFKKVD